MTNRGESAGCHTSRDREGSTGLLYPRAATLSCLQVLRVETGDDGALFQPWVNAHLPVRLAVVTPPWTGVRGVWAPVLDGDTVLPTRRVVERPHAGMTHCRRLSRDGEGTHTSHEALLSAAMTLLMVSRLARPAA